jgi:hypothetical protein
MRQPALNSGSDAMTPEDLAGADASSAAARVAEFGLAVVPSRIPRELIARLREQVVADVDYIRSRPELIAPVSHVGHMVTTLPARCELLFREVLLDELVLSVCTTLFGLWPRFRLESYQCNVNLPGSVDQGLHADMGQLWPGLVQPPPPHALIVNIPLVDVDERNGAIEVWPSSHHNPGIWVGGSQWVDAASAESQRSVASPLRLTTPAGSLILRDGRLWHRGRSNPSPTPRPMIALVYVVPWIRMGLGRFPLPRAAELLLGDPRIEFNAELVDGDFDYRGTIPND